MAAWVSATAAEVAAWTRPQTSSSQVTSMEVPKRLLRLDMMAELSPPPPPPSSPLPKGKPMKFCCSREPNTEASICGWRSAPVRRETASARSMRAAAAPRSGLLAMASSTSFSSLLSLKLSTHARSTPAFADFEAAQLSGTGSSSSAMRDGGAVMHEVTASDAGSRAMKSLVREEVMIPWFPRGHRSRRCSSRGCRKGVVPRCARPLCPR